MNRRGFLRSLALTAAAIALGRSIGEPVVEPPAPKTHPLFSGEMGRYEGLTIRHIEALRAKLEETPQPQEYFLIVPRRQVAALRRQYPGVNVRPQVRLRQGGWA